MLPRDVDALGNTDYLYISRVVCILYSDITIRFNGVFAPELANN